ncbi:hypothetical protein PHYSODRAFT_299648 [Phytophthora sojae]|uniref:Uncharacterized protein n=1 Tax=Phytophthora sojae (strain P6497) TaxID=1094619 RepID=G4Z4U7_PHYSP|nr:hypothetical protein PHYSODRAFT_299648 [Phytophthora sojae]EGZ22276.1 hypothetical protein PHYSODRAFT_299648 [Phytophthora sojae]|eukprot:XP_009524993.1 hypothetical protein PHYSODRAFT_299648 [Phytophthora sojae]
MYCTGIDVLMPVAGPYRRPELPVQVANGSGVTVDTRSDPPTPRRRQQTLLSLCCRVVYAGLSWDAITGTMSVNVERLPARALIAALRALWSRRHLSQEEDGDEGVLVGLLQTAASAAAADLTRLREPLSFGEEAASCGRRAAHTYTTPGPRLAYSILPLPSTRHPLNRPRSQSESRAAARASARPEKSAAAGFLNIGAQPNTCSGSTHFLLRSLVDRLKSRPDPIAATWAAAAGVYSVRVRDESTTDTPRLACFKQAACPPRALRRPTRGQRTILSSRFLRLRASRPAVHSAATGTGTARPLARSLARANAVECSSAGQFNAARHAQNAQRAAFSLCGEVSAPRAPVPVRPAYLCGTDTQRLAHAATGSSSDGRGYGLESRLLIMATPMGCGRIGPPFAAPPALCVRRPLRWRIHAATGHGRQAWAL